jgi:MSHA biogenesis protein MshO
MNRPRLASHSRGFTLIEAVMVIALTGIVGAMVAVFIRQPINAYFDMAQRGEMSDQADAALRRMARELQGALPNSVRVNAAGTYLEFLPVRSAGRYRAAPDGAGVGDFLDFSSTVDGSFQVLGQPVSAAAGDQLVVYNLGVVGADAYAGTSRRTIISGGPSIVYATGGTQFPYASPNNRFFVIGTPVTFVCAPGAWGTPTQGTLRRLSGYPIQAAQPANVAAAPLNQAGVINAVLAGGPYSAQAAASKVLPPAVTACSFTYNNAASSRNSVVTLRLTISNAAESITLLQQVHVGNSP